MKAVAKHKKGITLIEVMVIVVIISFLIVFSTIYLRLQFLKGNDAKRKADIKRISIAVEEYEKDNNCYPLPSNVTCNPGTGLQPYLENLPCDPVTHASYFYEHENSSCPRWFKIYSVLENKSDDDIKAGIGPASAFNYYYGSPNAPASIVTDTETSGTATTAPAEMPETDFYGCFSGSCTMIQWDSSRPGPVCDPNFQNATCYDQCSIPANECKSWNE